MTVWTHAPAQGRRDEASSQAFVARVHLAVIWLLVFSGGFVIVEPAPYEFLLLIAIGVFAVTGLSLRASLLPMIVLLIVQNIGFAIGVIPVIDLPDTLKWGAISALVAISTIFFAMVLLQDTERRLDVLVRAYVASAVVCSIIAVAAFFHLFPGWGNFIFNLRARSTFKDPNVFGPFLVFPALIVMQRIIAGGGRDILFGGTAFLVITAGLFLSFSRGAWGNLATSAAVMLILMALTTRSNRERARIGLFAIVGTMAVATIVLALLSVPDISDLFQDRATLVKNYDAGHGGRFGRHILGLLMIPDIPFGIGPFQFTKLFGEEAHNSFLDPFMSGGWLGGATWFTLTLVTLVLGLRHSFIRTPWQATYIATFAAFVGEVGESYVIDVQHWRHYFLLMGVLWGLTAVHGTLPRPRPIQHGVVAPPEAGADVRGLPAT